MNYAISLALTDFITRARLQTARRGRTQRRHTIAMLAVGFALIALLGNVALGQELDSSTLQKEAAAAQNSPDAKAQPPVAQPQAQPVPSQPQTAPAQIQPPVPQPQMSQPQATLPQMSSSQAAQPANSAFMLPPGTKLPLGLLRPLRVKTGRDVYLQITFPVTVGSEMVIPPGTYIQGVLDKIVRRDRRRSILEFSIRSANLIFLNGYTVPISGTVTVGTTNAALGAPQPGKGQSVPAMAAVGGPTTPTLPPDPFAKDVHTAMVVIGVVGAVAVTTAIVLAARSDTYVEVGTPLEIILPAPLFLDANRVIGAIQQYNLQASYAPVQIVQPPVKPKMCYDPGSPGTPDTVIPGNSGTPDTVIPGVNGAPDTVIPGIPATPDRTIPGSPGTPSSTYPCPQ
jgi:hypothetical protein